jgi:hypothetical protein
LLTPKNCFFNPEAPAIETPPAKGEEFSRPKCTQYEEPEDQAIPALKRPQQRMILGLCEEPLACIAGWRKCKPSSRILHEVLLFDRFALMTSDFEYFNASLFR